MGEVRRQSDPCGRVAPVIDRDHQTGIGTGMGDTCLGSTCLDSTCMGTCGET
jgi:hypothetical protein